jgi:mono/diheme cytochrome c family protein
VRFHLTIVSFALLGATRAGAQSPDPAATADHAAAGTYTEAQAARGKVVYESVCAACHTTSFHTDETFRFNWFGRSVLDLFKTLKTTMPEDNPGGLSDDDYARVIAYILKLNGFAAGPDSLPVDSVRMKSIRIRAASDSASSHK